MFSVFKRMFSASPPGCFADYQAWRVDNRVVELYRVPKTRRFVLSVNEQPIESWDEMPSWEAVKKAALIKRCVEFAGWQAIDALEARYGRVMEYRGQCTLRMKRRDQDIWSLLDEYGTCLLQTHGHRPAASEICFAVRIAEVGLDKACKEFG